MADDVTCRKSVVSRANSGKLDFQFTCRLDELIFFFFFLPEKITI